MRYRRDLLVAMLIVGSVLAVGAVFGGSGWPGDPSPCVVAGTCDCEALSGARPAQPINTFSNLGFILVGLWIIAGGALGAARNRLTGLARYRILFGAGAIAVGLGSMAFHSSVTHWGAWADLLPIVFIFTLVLIYALARWGDRSDQWFTAALVGAQTGALGLTLLVGQSASRYVLAPLVLAIVLVEWQVCRSPHRRMPLRFAAGAAGLYLTGGVLWVLSGSGGPWCDPDGPFHGHALWHLLAAAAFATLYRYFAGESAATGDHASA